MIVCRTARAQQAPLSRVKETGPRSFYSRMHTHQSESDMAPFFWTSVYCDLLATTIQGMLQLATHSLTYHPLKKLQHGTSLISPVCVQLE